MNSELPLSFEESTQATDRRFLLAIGEELSSSLERGYFDLCAENSNLFVDAPSAQIVSNVENSRSAGYPVLVELRNADRRVVPVANVTSVFFRSDKDLRHQQQAVPTAFSITELKASVTPEMFAGAESSILRPPPGSDDVLSRLERLAAGILTAVAARKTPTVSRGFIDALLTVQSPDSGLMLAVSNLRHGRDPTDDPVHAFAHAMSEQMLTEDNEHLGSSRMLEIVETIFARVGLTDEVTYEVVSDLHGFVSVLGGDVGSRKVFTPILTRIHSNPNKDAHAIANLLVMRPRLNDLLMWSNDDHGATEEQFVASAYILGLSAERRYLPIDIRSRALDVLLVDAIARGLAMNQTVLPDFSTEVTIGTRPTGALTINGEPIARKGPLWIEKNTHSDMHQSVTSRELQALLDWYERGRDVSIPDLDDWYQAGSKIIEALGRK